MAVRSGSYNDLTAGSESEDKDHRSSPAAGSRVATRASLRRIKPIACNRCHSRKVKCSGGNPCGNCQRSGIDPSECTYPRKSRVVKVSQQYLDDLVSENKRLRAGQGPLPTSSTTKQNESATALQDKAATEGTSSLSAPSLAQRPWFFDMNIPHTPVLIGEPSDSAFATRFRQAMSSSEISHMPRVHYATDERLLTLSHADCPWPMPSRARLFVNTALKYVSRTYHIVRQSQILDGLEQTLQNPQSTDSLLQAKLWIMFAIGELYSTRTAAVEETFPGIAYFARSTRILCIVSERPRLDAIETRLLLSFYLLALNRRFSAYALSGSAVRLSMVMGLHLNVSESQLPDKDVREHRNRVWWTAYVFDRMCAQRLGLPVAVQNEMIEVDLPMDLGPGIGAGDFGDASYDIASLRLAGFSARITHLIYSRKVQQPGLSQRVQEALKELHSWAEGLPQHLHLESKTLEPGHKLLSLHLFFNQSAICATRPILLHVLRTHVAAWQTQPPSEPQIPASAMTLAEACIRCARHSCRLLIDCWIDGTFATFDYFFTQYLFSAATILGISSLLDGKDSRNDKDQFESSVQFLSQLKHNGSFAAAEYCQHIDAIRLLMIDLEQRRRDPAAGPVYGGSVEGGNQLPTMESTPALVGNTGTAGMVLSEPSLQELLAQPVFDLQFIDASMHHGASPGLYWPDMTNESWPSDGWPAG